ENSDDEGHKIMSNPFGSAIKQPERVGIAKKAVARVHGPEVSSLRLPIYHTVSTPDPTAASSY
ncbi:MAG TPA: hypothetical protein VIH54_00470, partial [Chthoniobacterales bacterium]